MQKTVLAVGAAAALLVAGQGFVTAQQQAPVDQPYQAPPSFAQLAKDKLPAVVNVATTQRLPEGRGPLLPQMPEIPELPEGSPFRDFFERFFDEGQPGMRPPPGPETALGSGFIIDAQGYVVTNNHVIEGAEEVRVIFQDDTTLEAEVVGRDPRTDLALLKVEPREPLPAVDWGDSDAAEVGDWVVAIGNPFGLGGTVTSGIISARARDINAGPYDEFLQTDAAINRGNSGGPLFNMDGRVIGVNTAIFSPTGGSVGIGFAVPSSVAQVVIQELREHGRVERGWLGVQIQAVTEDIATALGVEEQAGALVSAVVPDSPAADAGIEVGDVIVGFSGQPVEDVRELQRLVAQTDIGEQVEMTVLRDGERVTLSPEIALLDEDETEVAAAEAVPEQPETPATQVLGLSLAELTPELRDQYQVAEEAEGVLVTDVDPASIAAERGLAPGDVIAQIGQTDVASPEDIVQALEQAREADRNQILVLREREGNAVFVPLPVEDQQG